jgi:hypothetical protein
MLDTERGAFVSAGVPWRGPGVGWALPAPPRFTGVFEFQAALDHLFDAWATNEFRAGRLPGNQEDTMTKFKFPLGALVVLSTSFAIAAKQSEDSDREVHEAAQRQASLAKDEAYRAAGRSDLIPPKAYAASDKTAWTISGLTSFEAPIEAGTVIARSEYLDAGTTPQYMVRYRAGDGRQTEQWFGPDALAFDPREKNQPTDDPMFAEVPGND